MEEQLNPLAVTHLLQYTLRSLCSQQDNNNSQSQWLYAVFWRILPRNYPPPKWDSHGGAYDRSRGNRRNWILVWEDGFCNFGASSSSSTSTAEMNSSGGEYNKNSSASSSANYGATNCTEFQQHFHEQQTPAATGLQPELFFKMSHEIYNYGEGLIGKVAADHSHKWIYKEPNNDQNQEINFLSAWHNSADAQPRTWEAQFQSGIKTIALIAVREGVVQLGGVQKVVEDLSYVVLLRKKFAYIESIPGVLLPHPSSAAFPAAYGPGDGFGPMPNMWAYNGNGPSPMEMGQAAQLLDHYGGYNHQQAAQQQPMAMRMNMITPSMSSLEALLSKLPSVGPGHGPGPGGFCGSEAHQFVHHLGNNPPSGRAALELMGSSQRVAKEEVDNNNDQENNNNNNHNHVISGNNNNNNNHEGEISSSISSYNHHFPYNNHHHHDLNLAVTRPGTGF